MIDTPDQGDEFSTFVNSSSLQKVVNAVHSGHRLVYLNGPAGSGKTTLAKSLEQNWKDEDKPAIYIQLSQVRTENDLYVQLSDQGNMQGPGAILRGSGQTLNLSVQSQLGAETQTLLILDGLDEVREEDAIFRFIRRMHSEPNLIVVVTGRSDSVDRRIASLFDASIVIDPFSSADLKEFLDRVAPELDLKDGDVERIKKATGGSPLAAKILVSLIDQRDLNALISEVERSEPNPTVLISAVLDKTLDDLEDKAAAHEVLAALSLLETIETKHLNTHQLKALSTLAQKGIVAETGGLLYATHVVVREVYRRRLSIAHDGFDPRSLSFGAEEAERDKLLEDTFQTLKGTNDILLGRKTIVVGDRGVGKSAYFSRLTKNSGTEADAPTFIPVPSPSNLLRTLEADGSPLATADQFKVGWLTLIACAMAERLVSTPDRRLRSAARDLLNLMRKDRDGAGIKRLFDVLFKTSISVKIGPVSLSPTLGKRLFRREVDIHWFIQSAVTTLNGDGICPIVAFDRIDEVHKYDRDLQEKALQGLFLAENELSSSGSSCVLIFVRSDLYEVYDLQEKNKLVSRTLTLRWTRSQLLDFLVSRVSASGDLPKLTRLIDAIPRLRTAMGTILIFPPLVEDTPVEDWLWQCLANGNNDINPRQILLLLVLASELEGKRVDPDARFSPLLSESALVAAMHKLSELSFKELVDDFRVGRTFLANCRAGRVDRLGIEEAEALCSDQDGLISRQLHQLERLGFLERVLVRGENGANQPEFRVPRLYTRGWSAGPSQ